MVVRAHNNKLMAKIITKKKEEPTTSERHVFSAGATGEYGIPRGASNITFDGMEIAVTEFKIIRSNNVFARIQIEGVIQPPSAHTIHPRDEDEVPF